MEVRRRKWQARNRHQHVIQEERWTWCLYVETTKETQQDSQPLSRAGCGATAMHLYKGQQAMHAAVVEMKDWRIVIHIPAVSIWMTSCRTPRWVHPDIHAFCSKRRFSATTACQPPRVLGMLSKLRGTFEPIDCMFEFVLHCPRSSALVPMFVDFGM